MGHYRVTIQEAAKRLGVKEATIRKRIERGTLEKEKGEDGRVYVFVDEPPAEERDTSHDEGYDSSYFAGYDALLKSHQERIEDLREQLLAERRANEENRRIIAALTQRIPELEAPREQAPSQEPPGSPETASDPPDRGNVPPATRGAQEPEEWPSSARRIAEGATGGVLSYLLISGGGLLVSAIFYVLQGMTLALGALAVTAVVFMGYSVWNFYSTREDRRRVRSPEGQATAKKIVMLTYIGVVSGVLTLILIVVVALWPRP